jgi:hypothetical protein
MIRHISTATTKWQTTLSIPALASMLVTTGLIIGTTNAFAASENNHSSGHGFDIKDFKITTFGIQNHNPFLKVEGTAGGTKPSNHNTIYGYVFKTDKGIFAVVSHFGKDSSEQSGPNDLDYHAHKITLDKNNCVSSLKETGTADLSGNTVKVLDTGANKVNSVLTAKLTVNNNHDICVDKVFDSQS